MSQHCHMPCTISLNHYRWSDVGVLVASSASDPPTTDTDTDADAGVDINTDRDPDNHSGRDWYTYYRRINMSTWTAEGPRVKNAPLLGCAPGRVR